MKNIIVTGSTGFIGRNLIPILIKENYNVLEITRDYKKSYELYKSKTVKFEINENQNLLIKFIKNFNPEICLHLASHITPNDTFEDSKKLIESNISFLLRLLDAFNECNLKFFINTGTFAEYGKGDYKLSPAYLYAATKTASRSFIEYYSDKLGFKFCTVIPYTIYGGNDSNKKVLDLIIDSLNSKEKIDFTHGEQILDFTHITDVVNFYFELINKTKNLLTEYHLGTGVGHSLKDVALILENLTKKRTNINWGKKKYRKNDVMYAVSNQNILKKFISLEEGLNLMLYKKYD